MFSSFLPWSAYDAGSVHITVNGFRASVLGDLFFLAAAALLLLTLAESGILGLPYSELEANTAKKALWLSAIAAAAVVLQVLLIAAAGHSTRPGVLIAIIATLLMIAGGAIAHRAVRRPQSMHDLLGDYDRG
jgi:hypothetical protein